MARTEEWSTTLAHGKDEMNLSEFPVTRLGKKDTRDVIEYYGWSRKNGEVEQRVWTVRAAAGLGLPGELGERILVALIAITAENGFESKRVEFSVYKLIKMLGKNLNHKMYAAVEESLKRLAGITITSDNAWMDHGQKKRVKSTNAFHVIDEVWLKYQEDDKDLASKQDCQGYIVWGERIWQSFKDGYIKNLYLEQYYSYRLPTTRRLYRFLDKRMAYQNEYVIDIYALANNLGMVPTQYASTLKRPIRKAFNELIESGFLTSAEFYKHGKYIRVKFSKHPPVVAQAPLFDEAEPETLTLSPEQEWWNEFSAYVIAGNRNAEGTLKRLALISKEDGVYLFESSQTDKKFINTATLILTRSLQAMGEQVVSIEIVERS